jgi:hypothetical protein
MEENDAKNFQANFNMDDDEDDHNVQPIQAYSMQVVLG